MRYVGKAIPDSAEIADKVSKGFNEIELQLIKDITDVEEVSKVYDIVREAGCHVVSVHAPIINHEVISVVDLTRYSGRVTLEHTMMLADKIGEQNEEVVYTVIHNDMSVSALERANALDTICDFLETCSRRFKHTKIAIENVIPLEVRKGEAVLIGAGLYDNVELANYLNNRLNARLFNTVLDICHALVTITELTRAGVTKYMNEGISIESFIEKNKNTLVMMHMNNVEDIGVEEHHGTAFNKDNERDMEIVSRIVNKLKSEGLDGILLTLEVREIDYLNSINAVKTREAIEAVTEKERLNTGKSSKRNEHAGKLDMLKIGLGMALALLGMIAGIAGFTTAYKPEDIEPVIGCTGGCSVFSPYNMEVVDYIQVKSAEKLFEDRKILISITNFDKSTDVIDGATYYSKLTRDDYDVVCGIEFSQVEGEYNE